MDIEDLRKRLDNLEYKDLKSINEDLTNIKIVLEKNNTLTEQCTRANEKLSVTMDTFKDAMSEISLSLKESNKVTTELANKMESFENKLNKTNDKMEEKFSELKKEVDSVDNKSKIDILDWVKLNWFKLIVALVMTGLILNQVFGENPLF